MDVVADALRPLRKQIAIALIFGSIARGEELSNSDIDLLIIGELGLSDLSPALREVEGKLKREVQAFVYTPKEFWHKFSREEHFMTSILNSPLLPVIGDIHDYIETAGK